ncbi:AtuA-related protein [Cupriavidus basilensis]
MNPTTSNTATPAAGAATAATIALYQLAHGRTGDKGDRSNISVIAYDPRDFDHLAAHVTEDAVAALFSYRRPSAVRRYLVPSLQAMNFVIDGVLDGGVNDALNLDTHGKALSFLLLQLEIPLPPRLAGAG